MHAFVEVYVAGHILRSKYTSTGEENRAPEYIQSFEFNRIDTGGTFILTIFDKNWDEVEYVFNQGFQHIQIRYGWVTGLTSPLYTCSASTYSIDFKNAGVIMSINGIVEGLSPSGAPGLIGNPDVSLDSSSYSSTSSSLPNTSLVTIDTQTINPTEAVKSIAQSQGWAIGTYVETEDIQLANEDSISMIKEYPITYINSIISPYSVSKNGVSGFRFYLDNSTNPPTSHFVPASSAMSLAASKTYVYAKGVNTSVIDLSLNINGVFGGTGSTSTVTQSTVQTIDPITKEVLGNSTNTNEQTATNESGYTHTPSNQASTFGASGVSAAQATAAQMYAMTTAAGAIPYSGSLTILGDPSINLMDTIMIAVITNKGNLHAASGVYMINEMVADSIQGGKFLTSMKVMKGTMPVGLEEVTPGGSSQTGSGGDTLGSQPSEESIWSYLYGKIPNSYGVAALMGNLFAESGLNSKNLQNSYASSLGMTDDSYTAAVDSGQYTNFVNDSAGYGLAQWTSSNRKQNLLNFARSSGRSIGSMQMQLDFLYDELSSSYPSVLRALNNATSVKSASDVVLTQYERPANQSSAVKSKRASYGQQYYNRYASSSNSSSSSSSSSSSASRSVGPSSTTCKFDGSPKSCRIRIVVPRDNSWVGHYDLYVSGSITFRGTTFTNPVFSYETDGKLHVYNGDKSKQKYSSKSKSDVWFMEYTAPAKNFQNFLNSLNSIISGRAIITNGYDYAYKLTNSFSTYIITKNNCFHALALWMNCLGQSTLLDIYKSSSSYRDYLPDAMKKKYSKYWKYYGTTR